MRIDELLNQGLVPELNRNSDGTVTFKGSTVKVVSGDAKKLAGNRTPDFAMGAWNWGQDGGAYSPCWINGNQAICDLNPRLYIRPSSVKQQR